ncbi:MAG: histidine kinase [Myxococcaceae bacterium]|nr:histidine kinase [Myxococcaceae bacterium]
MFLHRVLLYFSVVAAMTIAATVFGEIVLMQRVLDRSRQSDMRLANGVAGHISAVLEDQHRELMGLLADLPADLDEKAVLEHLKLGRAFMFEPGGVTVFSQRDWGTGVELSPGGSPPRQILLPALRLARQTGALTVTSMWRGTDGFPRVCLVARLPEKDGWRAVVANIRLDQMAFLSHFGFILKDQDVRLQILDGAGIALFSTVPGERYRSVVHGTYLLDRVRQGQTTQQQCHSCHEGEGGQPTRRENEISTLASVSGTPWSVLLRENSSAVQQIFAEMVATAIAMVCLILGALTGFYLLLNRQVLRPLRQLASAAAAVSAATSASPPPEGPRDEMERLAQSFETILGQPEDKGREALAPAPGDAPPSELRESLRRALAPAVHGFRNVEVASALIVSIEGGAIGDPPLVVGSEDLDIGAIEATLRQLGRERSRFTTQELADEGVDVTPFKEIVTFYRTDLRALDLLHGDVWVGTRDPQAVPHLKPISVLITLHMQGVVDRSLLSNKLWHEYRQKKGILGHLFEAEAEERKRIARDIHDDTAQSLAALALLLETVPIGGDPQKQEQAVRTAQERVRGIIDSTDRIMKRLRPALLDDLGLVDAVRDLGENVLASEGIDFEFEAPEDEIRAEPEIEDAVYRVFLEAASNVVRHAHANHVSARIDVVDGQILGSLEDDGRGMQQPSEKAFSDRPRFGLLGMRERVTLLDGTFRLSPSKLGGLRVEVSVPYRPRKPRPSTPPGPPP